MAAIAPPPHHSDRPHTSWLTPLRHWLNQIQVQDRRVAYLLCKFVPPACPFERTLTAFGYTLHIPALCKINPLFDELMTLRFRALTYLADVHGED